MLPNSFIMLEDTDMANVLAFCDRLDVNENVGVRLAKNKNTYCVGAWAFLGGESLITCVGCNPSSNHGKRVKFSVILLSVT